MDLGAFGQQPLASTLATPRKGGASGFRAHPRAKTVLVFPGAFRALKCAFHEFVSLKRRYLTKRVASVNYLS
jgi:hypothetical protein